MSQGNVEVVRVIYESWDRKTMSSLLTPRRRRVSRLEH
jgi:hypothetical protein